MSKESTWVSGEIRITGTCPGCGRLAVYMYPLSAPAGKPATVFAQGDCAKCGAVVDLRGAGVLH